MNSSECLAIYFAGLNSQLWLPNATPSILVKLVFVTLSFPLISSYTAFVLFLKIIFAFPFLMIPRYSHLSPFTHLSTANKVPAMLFCKCISTLTTFNKEHGSKNSAAGLFGVVVSMIPRIKSIEVHLELCCLSAEWKQKEKILS